MLDSPQLPSPPFLRKLQVLHWLKNYKKTDLIFDIAGAAVVSFMFLPQSLAYAILAGLPPQAGVYASIIPLLGYMLFGTSRVLAIGPVAVISLMTAAALAPLATPGTAEYTNLALLLALTSGLMLTLMGIFRLGFLANFLSHSVISGFVMASSVLIALSQVKTILGIKVSGTTLVEVLPSLVREMRSFNSATLTVALLQLSSWWRCGFS